MKRNSAKQRLSHPPTKESFVASLFATRGIQSSPPYETEDAAPRSRSLEITKCELDGESGDLRIEAIVKPTKNECNELRRFAVPSNRDRVLERKVYGGRNRKHTAPILRGEPSATRLRKALWSVSREGNTKPKELARLLNCDLEQLSVLEAGKVEIAMLPLSLVLALSRLAKEPLCDMLDVDASAFSELKDLWDFQSFPHVVDTVAGHLGARQLGVTVEEFCQVCETYVIPEYAKYQSERTLQGTRFRDGDRWSERDSLDAFRRLRREQRDGH